MSYVAIAENMKPDEVRDFDRELVAPPGVQVSRGVDTLMAVVRQTKPPAKPRAKGPAKPAAKKAGRPRAKKGGSF